MTQRGGARKTGRNGTWRPSAPSPSTAWSGPTAPHPESPLPCPYLSSPPVLPFENIPHTPPALVVPPHCPYPWPAEGEKSAVAIGTLTFDGGCIPGGGSQRDGGLLRGKGTWVRMRAGEA